MVMIHPERDTRRADLLVKIDAANQAAKRIPRHWVDSKAAIHARLDMLCEELAELDRG